MRQGRLKQAASSLSGAASPAPGAPGSSALRRSLGLVDSAALVVGCVIGAGIFRTAASVATQISSPGLTLALWAAGGAVSFFGALCYAELGAAYPRTGGDYVYLTKAYGPAVGFLFGWTKIFTERIGTVAILGYVFAEYLGSLWALNPVGIKLLATVGIGLLTLANVLGIQVGKEVQNGLTTLKLLALFGIIGVGLFSGNARPELLQPFWPQAAGSFWPGSAGPLSPEAIGLSGSEAARLSWFPGLSWFFGIGGQTWAALGVAFVFVLWTYGGWTEAAYVAEEIRDPSRNLPWAILCGLGVVTALYLLVNTVYLLHIPLSEMPSRPLVASEVMQATLGPIGGKVTSLMVALSAFGALNGYILTSGRILLAVGWDHPLFGWLAKVHPKFATPAKALSFNALAAFVLLWIGTFEQIMTYSTVVISVFFAMTALGVIVLRRKDPETPRPYRVWGYPVTPLLFVLAMALFIGDICWMQPKESLLGFGLMGLGLPLYLWSRSRQARREILR